jgi:hypothetical protein
MISRAEHVNFLRQCWRAGLWKDGVNSIVSPLRLSLYHFRKQRFGAPKNGFHGEQAVVSANNGSHTFSREVHPIFCERLDFDPSTIRSAEVFAEVDAQLQRSYRLAGGRRSQLSGPRLNEQSDAEDIHAYHRLYWAVRYAQGAYFGHAASGPALVTEISQWLASRTQMSALGNAAYTVAERIGSLTAVLFWIGDGAHESPGELIVPLKRQIFEDAQRLSINIEHHLGVHNHLLNDARGLFLASAALWQECDEAAAWRESAFKIWDEYFPKLIFADGALTEQSSHYHLLLCRTALEYALACYQTGHQMPAAFAERLPRMFALANQLLRPDGSLPRFGDNSPDRTVEDLWGLLAAAFYYGLLQNAPRHRAITPLTLFYCGVSPLLPAAGAQNELDLFPDGGFAFVRSENVNAELAAHGDNGRFVGTHGDVGRGSYELWWNGNILVREPGSSTGSSDSCRYQSAESQNVTTLDGLSPAVAKQDERFLPRWYSPNGGSWTESGDGFEFRCDSFKRLDPSIVLHRAWRFEQPDTFTFLEKIDGAKTVHFESRICLGDASWTPIADATQHIRNRFQWKGQDGSAAEMAIEAPAHMALETRPSTFLPEYGVEKEGRSLLLSGSVQLPFSWKISWRLRNANVN